MTAVITPFGLWEFLRMPFGLRGAAQTFQRFMDRVTQGLRNIFVYMDDILIASESAADHQDDLRALFQRLDEHGLVVKKAKCVFGVDSIDFLGHRVDGNGITPLEEKVRAIRDFPTPTNVEAVQRFLGMINYYHRFVPDVAGICAPLSDTLKGKRKKKNADIEWTPELQTAFDAAKNGLADATMLVHPIAGAPLALTVDASQFAVGAKLEQHVDDMWQPLGFFSRKLRTPTELKFPAFDRELMGAHLATRHFRYLIEGRAFTLYTDQDALVPAMRKATEPHNARQTTQLSNLSEYTTDIREIAGKDNVVADALSRAPVEDAPPLSPIVDAPNVAASLSVAAIAGIDFDAIARAQQGDAATIAIRRDAATSLRLVEVERDNSPALLCDESTGRLRPFVPANFRRTVFDVLHNLSLPGIQATKKLVAGKFVWPKLATDVVKWARACPRCQPSKVQCHVAAPLQDFPPVERRFEHIHVDVVGPLPASLGYTHLLTVVDRFTRWPEAFPVTETSTLTLARTLLHGWIARFRTPAAITSDRGAQFVSELWRNFSKLLGADLHPTTAYHPQANGLVERMHRDLKASLRARLDAAENAWADQLPWVLLGLRTMVKRDLKTSSAELVYGEPLVVPGDFIAPPEGEDAAQTLARLREDVQRLRPIPTSRHGCQPNFVPTNLADADYVFVRRDGHKSPLSRPYTGPFRVVERGDKTFKLECGGKVDTFTIDRLKRAYEDDDVAIVPAQPPRRGRPPAAPPDQQPPQQPPQRPPQPPPQPPPHDTPQQETTLGTDEYPPLPVRRPGAMQNIFNRGLRHVVGDEDFRLGGSTNMRGTRGNARGNAS